MSQRSPALRKATRERGVNSSQASFILPVKRVLQAGINAEEILLSKASQLLNYSAMEFGDLHPGFRGNRISDKKEQASILCIKWTFPPKVVLNDNWHVAAGEQSEEIRFQEQRGTGVTEVVYPHPSAIPTSPSISLDVEEGHLDDGHNTPIIPLTPVQDDAMDSSCEVEPPSSTKEGLNSEVLQQGVPVSHTANASQLDASAAAQKPRTWKHPLGLLTGLEADIGAAASAAFTALMKSYEQGSLIDTDLLIKILSDPKMIELLNDGRSFGNNLKSTVQLEPEVAVPSPSLTNPRLENSDSIRPSLSTPSVLHLNSHSSSPSRYPVKEGSNKLPTTMQLTSKKLGMLVSDTAIPSVPLSCSMLDTMLLLKHVHENPDTLLKRVHPASDLMNFISSVDMAIPKSEQPLQQKLENLVHDSFPVPKPTASSVAMSTRLPRNGVTSSAPLRLSFLSKTTSLSSSAGKSSSSVKAPPPIKDTSYYKSLVRQHGVERQEAEGPNLLESGNLSAHLQRQGLGKLKVSSSRPCIYFSSPKGCRLGLSCPYRHDLSTPQLRAGTVSEAASGKRVKLNREIYGRT